MLHLMIYILEGEWYVMIEAMIKADIVGTMQQKQSLLVFKL